MQVLLAQVFEGDIHLTRSVFLHAGRDADLTGRSQTLEPGRDVDAIAEDVLVLDDVAHIDPDPRMDLQIGGNRGVPLAHSGLHLGRAAQRIDNRGKFNQEPVAGRLYDPAPMVGDLAIEQIGADRLEKAERTLFIGADQARVTGNIRRRDGRKPAFHWTSQCERDGEQIQLAEVSKKMDRGQTHAHRPFAGVARFFRFECIGRLRGQCANAGLYRSASPDSRPIILASASRARS